MKESGNSKDSIGLDIDGNGKGKTAKIIVCD